MPIFSHSLTLAAKSDEVFEFLRMPKHRVQLMPPDWPVELLAGPELLELGSKTTWKVTRLGMSQVLVHEVTACEPPTRMVEEQRQGPFRRWVQSTACSPTTEGVVVQDEIEYDSPGGMLGLLLTSGKIEASLRKTFEWRDRQLRELFAK